MNPNPSARLGGSLPLEGLRVARGHRVKAATGGFQNASSSANTIIADAIEAIP